MHFLCAFKRHSKIIVNVNFNVDKIDFFFFSLPLRDAFFQFKRIRNKMIKLVGEKNEHGFNTTNERVWWLKMSHTKLLFSYSMRNDETKWDVINSIIYYWIIRDEKAHAHNAVVGLASPISALHCVRLLVCLHGPIPGGNGTSTAHKDLNCSYFLHRFWIIFLNFINLNFKNVNFAVYLSVVLFLCRFRYMLFVFPFYSLPHQRLNLFSQLFFI